ncbi:ATP-binding protein [Microbacterium sp. BK668]|uniref:sensor histidine kinase n=1 Tax=Microbacterium sp. BK668 TaxID=2512118 RepID=UPI0010E75693|nr:ATP-binding protein [Microbacterium sp. BK668]TDN87857.1 signal transduction histidine kinase [Microbacterium sp. BK668]
MTADATGSVLDDAWGHIPQTRETNADLGSFTRRRIERAITLAVAFGAVVLGTQAFLYSFRPPEEGPGWHLALVLGTFGPLALMLLACVIGRGVRFFSGLFALLYLGALLLWPLATEGGTVGPPTEQPWIWYLVNVGTVAAVLAFPFRVQLVWTALLPLVFGVVRLVQVDFARAFLQPVLLDVSFALILGFILLTLAWVFRSVSANVDETRARAVESYAAAAAAAATEQERVAVAALMHDSVLAALIAAERAHTDRERTLAAAMAREALTRLANTEQDPEEGPDEPRDASAIADEIEHVARELGVEIRAERTILGDSPSVPGRVARALTLATLQAITNSIEHADGEGLGVAVRAVTDPVRVRIEVRDTGRGFDLEEVPDDRLGIRASIIARVAAVGGTTRIASGEHGTTVRLEWREAEA